MKKVLFLIFGFGLFLLAGCEKEQLSPLENEQDLSAALDFRSADPDCTQPACEAVVALINDVTDLITDGQIGQGPGQSILSKLESIKRKLEQGQTEVAQVKLAELIIHLEGLEADGELSGDLLVTLTESINAVGCEIDPSGEECGPGTIFSATGQVWMDRNLGASQVATNSIDTASYGDLYQWGRGEDGHESRTSSTNTATSAEDQPGHGDFIITGGSDWRNPPNDNLWQGVAGVNNPCPAGYRLPTEAEWQAEVNEPSGHLINVLKLPLAGLRDADNFSDPFYGDGSIGFYWSSTFSESRSYGLYINPSYDSEFTFLSEYRADGYSVRCLKD